MIFEVFAGFLWSFRMEKDPGLIETVNTQELKDAKNFDMEDIFGIAKDKYPKKCDIYLKYGNAGFRSKYEIEGCKDF